MCKVISCAVLLAVPLSRCLISDEGLLQQIEEVEESQTCVNGARECSDDASLAYAKAGSLPASTWNIEELCPERLVLPKKGGKISFPLNLTHLRLRKDLFKVWVCENRTDQAGGVLGMEGLLDVVGGAGGLKPETVRILDEEILSLLGRDIVDHRIEPIQLAVRTSPPAEGATNVHHDRNKMPPGIYATSLTYLNDEEDGLEGGHTIFPTLTRPGVKKDKRQQELSDLLHKKWDKVLLDYEREHVIIETRGSRALDLVNDMCANRNETDLRKANYFPFKPRLDLTILAWHAVGKRKGPYEVETGEHWHAGCGRHSIRKIIHLRFIYLRSGLEPGAELRFR